MRSSFNYRFGLPSPFYDNETGFFSPASLFAFAEPGVWFDPSDVANLNWRVNLVTFSEQFDNAAWQIARATKGSAQLDPNGGMTAIRITATSAAGDLYQGISSENVSRANSVWLRRVSGTGGIQLSTPANGGVTMDVTSTWQRFSTSGLPAGGIAYIVIRILTSGDVIDVAFAQQELGTAATTYQPITDVNTEVIQRFPYATLYQDLAGTIPVTGPTNLAGQASTVALMLDKSKGLVPGPELTNSALCTIDAATTRVNATTFSVNNTGGAAANYVTNFPAGASSVVVGRTYEVTITTSSYSGAAVSLKNISQSVNLPVNGTAKFLVTPTATSMYIRQDGTGVTSFTAVFSVRELAGNHATQATLAARPTYSIEPVGGRRNLLGWTEQFNETVWIKASGAAITANTDTAPDGTLTADTLTTSGVPSFSAGLITQAVSVAATGVTFTFSVYLKASSTNKATIWLNLAGGAERVAVVVNLTSSYQRYTVSATFTSGSIVYPHVVAGDANLGTNAGSILIWGAQLELGSTATAYQRVTTQHDVTEAGVASVGYLYFDGAGDFMFTSTITPGTDKAQVFAGVRKLSDATTAVLVETSAAIDTNDGAFLFRAPAAAGANSYRFDSKGTIISAAGTGVFAAAPVTSVLTGLGDISGDTSTLRLNGVVAGTGTGDQGTGNYLAYPLFIGSRGNAGPPYTSTSLPFSGHLYSLITRFGANLDAPTIASTEIWVGDKTGIDVAKNISTTIYTRSGDTILDRANSTIERRA